MNCTNFLLFYLYFNVINDIFGSKSTTFFVFCLSHLFYVLLLSCLLLDGLHLKNHLIPPSH